MGDMPRVGTKRSTGLVHLVFNAIGNLLTQDQVGCFENAARRLTGDGVFVVSAGCRPRRPGWATGSSSWRSSSSTTSGWVPAAMTRSPRSWT